MKPIFFCNQLQTILGIGKLTAVAILAESPDLDSFNSAKEFAAYAGLTSKHRVSGTSVKGKSAISKIGSAKLRKALYFPAIVAKNHNPIFKQFTQKLSSKGKPTKVIIVAIMRKLLHIRLLSKLYFCW
ncbi:MAG: transposase [Candidatus Tisiphia sp.]